MAGDEDYEEDAAGCSPSATWCGKRKTDAKGIMTVRIRQCDNCLAWL